MHSASRNARLRVFFRAQQNISYARSDWNGTFRSGCGSTPRGELEPGFCDPVKITPRAWNDAAFFVEFEKRPEGIPFRLGVYADLDVWNPAKRKFEDIPASERPLVTVTNPPFSGNKWTHVVFTFERFNTGKPDGVARSISTASRVARSRPGSRPSLGPRGGNRRSRPQLHRVARRAVDLQSGADAGEVRNAGTGWSLGVTALIR